MSQLTEEISRRRTFAIISHPDAGKTTLTEKFLLYGGAIAQAGVVKGKKNSRAATSDWMEIEKQRGISVTSSVMQFQYNGFCINILDTPGHQDFSEDTYRTLMAADSAVMVIDGAKGVEPQTRKLFKVCAMRHIPIFTFVNKMDREAKDPFDLLDEVERELGIETYAMNWPIGSGRDFQGVYDREKAELLFFSGISGKKRADKLEIDLYDPQVAQLLDSEEKHRQLIDDVELLSAGREMDMQAVRDGQLSPVFFGSALTNFGIEPFLEAFLKLTPPPLARTADCGVIDPFSPDFSAFVFKIQANMNKAHRDRLAFMRICSGKFQRDAEYFHVQGNKKMRLSQPQQLMAADREDKGYSEAWMHHKGRNRHHYEYWTDMNRETKCYEPVPMPRRYFVEMVMDRRAACMTYQGKAYRDDSALQYFERSREKDLMHPETSRQLRFILGMLAEKGEAETFSYLRRSVLKGKPFPWEEAQDSLMRK